MTPELHRPVATDRVGQAGLDVDVEATPAECRALAERMLVPAVLALHCRFRLSRAEGETIIATGHLTARIVQICVVSLEEFEAAVADRFRVRFVPSGTETDDPDPDSDDEIPFDHGLLDLGEAAAEQLALTLEPYPRRPDAELPRPDDGEQENPFAALAALRRPD